jgi:hypothetical protein
MRTTPEVTKEMATITAQQYLYTNEKVRKALNFEFMPVEESIRDGCRAFLNDIIAV